MKDLLKAAVVGLCFYVFVVVGYRDWETDRKSVV